LGIGSYQSSITVCNKNPLKNFWKCGEVIKKSYLSSSEIGFHFPRAIRPPCELNPDDTWGRLWFQMDSIQIGGASQGGQRKAKKGTRNKKETLLIFIYLTF
jgi:hypothetical protein